MLFSSTLCGVFHGWGQQNQVTALQVLHIHLYSAAAKWRDLHSTRCFLLLFLCDVRHEELKGVQLYQPGVFHKVSGGCICHIYPSHADHTESAVNQASFYARVWLTYDYSLIWWLWETTLGKCDSSWVINAPVVNCWVVIYITDGWLLQQTWLRIIKITAVDQGNNQHPLCLF